MLPLQTFNLRMIALLVTPLLVAQPATAAARIQEIPSITVRYHDLNLDSPQGIASLYERIHAAAVDVCSSAEAPQPLNRTYLTEWDVCTNHAVAHAVRAVHNEKLSAYYWERIRGWRFR